MASSTAAFSIVILFFLMSRTIFFTRLTGNQAMAAHGDEVQDLGGPEFLVIAMHPEREFDQGRLDPGLRQQSKTSPNRPETTTEIPGLLFLQLPHAGDQAFLVVENDLAADLSRSMISSGFHHEFVGDLAVAEIQIRVLSRSRRSASIALPRPISLYPRATWVNMGKSSFRLPISPVRCNVWVKSHILPARRYVHCSGLVPVPGSLFHWGRWETPSPSRS